MDVTFKLHETVTLIINGDEIFSVAWYWAIIFFIILDFVWGMWGRISQAILLAIVRKVRNKS